MSFKTFLIVLVVDLLVACASDGDSPPGGAGSQAAAGSAGASAGAMAAGGSKLEGSEPVGQGGGIGGAAPEVGEQGGQAGAVDGPFEIAAACEVDCKAKQPCVPGYPLQSCVADCAEMAAQCPGRIPFLQCVSTGITYTCGPDGTAEPDRCIAERDSAPPCSVGHQPQPAGAGGSASGSVGGAGGSF